MGDSYISKRLIEEGLKLVKGSETMLTDEFEKWRGQGCANWTKCAHAHSSIDNGWPVMRCVKTGRHPDYCTNTQQTEAGE